MPPGASGQSYASGISADGSVIVGTVGYDTPNPRAFRWIVGSPVAEILDAAPGSVVLTDAAAVSADGLTIVGTGNILSPPSGPVAARWSVASGGVSLGVLPGAVSSRGSGVSADGRVIVGGSGASGFRWTLGGGMASLGLPTGFDAWQALCVSADGAVIAGSGTTPGSPSHAAPVSWTQLNGPHAMLVLPDASNTYPSDMSGDSLVMVGTTYRSVGPQPIAATIWTSEGSTQPRHIRTFLLDRYGVQIPAAWYLAGAIGISADQRTIVGYGSPGSGGAAWVIRFPAPIGCFANCDGSTLAPVLNVNDFICFLGRFGTGDVRVNCDQSTVPPLLNVSDFICFMNRYAAGCQ